MTVPLERQKNIADVAPRVREQLGLGSAAVSDVSAFATAAQGEKADDALPADMLPITATRNGMEALEFPAGMNSLETRGYAAMGVGRAAYVRVDAEPSHGLKVRSADRFLPNGSVDPVNGGWWEIAEKKVDILMAGAKGDCSGVGLGTDDSAAIQRAFSWLAANPTGTVEFPGGGRYRMSYGASLTFAGGQAGRVIMHGPITPDPGIGNAITIYNGLGGEFILRVRQGGQDADYRQKDPVGGDQAFVIRGFRGANLEVYNEVGYKGRLLRIPEGLPGERKNSFYTIRKLYTGLLIAGLEDIGGQAFYIDTNDNAFGQILSVNPVWDKYGPVFEDTTDITITHMEGGWRMGSSGLEFRGCHSVWGGTIEVGDETKTVDLITFKNSAQYSCNNILIDRIFVVGAARGLVLENVGKGSISGGSSTGIKINGIITKTCTLGMDLIDTRDAEITQLSHLDGQSWRESGASSIRNYIKSKSLGAGAVAMEIQAGAGLNGVYEPTIDSANTSGSADAPAFKITSTQPLEIRNPLINVPASTSAFQLEPNNNVRVYGGRIAKTLAFTNRPKEAKGVFDYVTESSGVINYGSGVTNIVYPHGLKETPEVVFLTPGHQETIGARAHTFTATTFTVTLPAATTGANRPVYWSAATAAGIGKATP